MSIRWFYFTFSCLSYWSTRSWEIWNHQDSEQFLYYVSYQSTHEHKITPVCPFGYGRYFFLSPTLFFLYREFTFKLKYTNCKFRYLYKTLMWHKSKLRNSGTRKKPNGNKILHHLGFSLTTSELTNKCHSTNVWPDREAHFFPTASIFSTFRPG